MDLKPGTIKHLQEYSVAKINERGFEDENLHERLLLLTEEIGELVKACRKLSGIKVDSKKEYLHSAGEELADVLNMTFAVGIELGLDIEKEFIEKNNDVDKRVYVREGKLHK